MYAVSPFGGKCLAMFDRISARSMCQRQIEIYKLQKARVRVCRYCVSQLNRAPNRNVWTANRCRTEADVNHSRSKCESVCESERLLSFVDCCVPSHAQCTHPFNGAP